ncbi:unnamed protein product [Effrenium voratum]|uniref:Uncharacterized protein n=1 Tax=Effrenium voratum TaxID=2562239 RepID=A0AA36NC57_9DINO|nr:unnamed protein product [Effrenium voratum]
MLPRLRLTLLPSLALAQTYAGCSSSESQGIAQCESPGESFFFDQNKAARCPDPGTWDHTGWSCDDWKCHMYCTNPARSSERKSCDNCDEVAVTAACLTAQTSACNTAKSSLSGCDVDCGGASSIGWRFAALLPLALAVR